MLMVIVLYKIPINQSLTWISLENAIDYPLTICIYDNSPESQGLPSTIHKIIYHHDPDNSGVAKAYNVAFRQCSKLGKHWLFLLDQDTTLTKTLFSAYANSVLVNPEERFFSPMLTDEQGILSPFLYRGGISKRVKKLDAGVHSFNSMRVANSCSLIHTSAFDLADGFDLNLPLDFSDIYFQGKLLPHISTFAVVPESILHEFSGSILNNKNKVQNRYMVFSKSCVVMSSKTGSKLNFQWLSLKRAFNLSFRFGTLRFVLLHFKIWFGK